MQASQPMESRNEILRIREVVNFRLGLGRLLAGIMKFPVFGVRKHKKWSVMHEQVYYCILH